MNEIEKFLLATKYDPLRYVIGAYPWNTEPSIQICGLKGKWAKKFPNCRYGPDEWQCDWLEEFGARLREGGFNGHDPVDPLRGVIVSGHGVGKTCLVGWMTDFIMSTRPYAVGTITANTNAQLKAKTWAEVGKWHHLSISQDMFVYSSASNNMSLVHKDKKKAGQWKCVAQTCDPKNSEAFAGQHSPHSFYIFDEASNIANELFEVREGGLISGESITLDMGNGTRNTGRYFENCNGKFKHRHWITQVDSRLASRTNKKKIEDDRQLYGEDSDYFRVRWAGKFPSRSSAQLVDTQAVIDAQQRQARIDHSSEPLIIGVDVARRGGDESVIYPRIGMDARTFKPRRLKNLDSHAVASAVVDMINQFSQIGIKYARVFVDGGGGYGAGVVDKLVEYGVNVTEVLPGERAQDRRTYMYRVDECWGELAKAVPDLLLPEESTEIGKMLFEELTQREFGYTVKEQVRLEIKESFKDRIGRSPDVTDALSLTFAEPVALFGRNGAGAEFIELEM